MEGVRTSLNQTYKTNGKKQACKAYLDQWNKFKEEAMWKKTVKFSVLGMLIMVLLSGCFNIYSEIYHHPDNSGRLVIEYEFPEEILTLDEEEVTMEEVREDLLGWIDLDQTYSADDPNILSVSSEDFIDPNTGSLHYIIDIEVINMLEPFGASDDEGTTLAIEANPDGTYRFSLVLEPTTELGLENGELDLSDMRALMEGTVYVWKLHVQEFIDGDSRAIYTPNENVVTWRISMNDLFYLETAYEIWAIYRTETPAVEVTDPDQEDIQPPKMEGQVDSSDQNQLGFLSGLMEDFPAWLPIVLAGLCCLTLVGVVVVILVFVVLKKRKQKEPYQMY